MPVVKSSSADIALKLGHPTSLRDFRFYDEPRLNSYISQLGGSVENKRKSSRKVSLSMKGPIFEMSSEEIPGSANPADKIDILVNLLSKNNLLRLNRPIEGIDWGAKKVFVYEETKASQIIIPQNDILKRLGISAVKIWISDPNPKDLNGPEWSFRGSFLYLTELIFDNNDITHMYSGCSALRFIVNAVSGENFRERSGVEIFGRDSSLHPLEKLESIGAVRGSSHTIQTLYKIRYMTDEQVFEFENQEHRTHDILGYPLFIATI